MDRRKRSLRSPANRDALAPDPEWMDLKAAAKDRYWGFRENEARRRRPPVDPPVPRKTAGATVAAHGNPTSLLALRSQLFTANLAGVLRPKPYTRGEIAELLDGHADLPKGVGTPSK